MKGKGIAFVFLVIFLFGLGLGGRAQAETECDDPDIYAEYLPSIQLIEEEMINALLAYVGDVSVTGMTIEAPLFIICPHTINITMLEGSVVGADMIDFQVQDDLVGTFIVRMYMNGSPSNPVLDSNVSIDVEHHGNPLFCAIENGLIDSILDGQEFGLRLASGELVQEADLCVTANCAPIHPMVQNTMTVTGLELDILGDGWGDALDDIISWLANVFSPAFSDMMSGQFEDERGMGVFISLFHLDIAYDNGCMPIPEVQECLFGSGCATTRQPRGAMGKRTNVLLYGVPVALMVGLIVRRRRG
jgi:hypothetical protein